MFVEFYSFLLFIYYFSFLQDNLCSILMEYLVYLAVVSGAGSSDLSFTLNEGASCYYLCIPIVICNIIFYYF
jgi:hypothetical protein